MNLLELIKQRKSVRSFLAMDIEPDKIDYIMECARLAPSAANEQPWQFLLVKDKNKQQLLKKCYRTQWFTSSDCPYYLVACGNVVQSWVRRSDGKDHCDIDVAIAAEHICLAIHEQGLGTCWICNFDAELLIELFDLPCGIYPLAIFPIGYPDVDFGEKTGRKNINEIVKVI